MYAAMMFDSPQSTGVLDIKGIALARGDSSKMTKDLQLAMIKHIMSNPLDAWPHCKELVLDAIRTIRDKDPKLLIKSRKLGSDYKFPERQVQWNVAKKMKIRGGSAPNVGDQVYYVVGKGNGGICARADAPESITEIDYEYYIKSQVLDPIKNILPILCADWRAELSL